MSKFLGRDEILGADDKDVKVVDVPEWGGKVRVSTITAEKRDKFEASMFQIRNFGTKNQKAEYKQENLRARLVAYTVVDEDGNRIFSENDIKKLGEKSAKALDRVFEVAQELNGISDEDVDEMTKN
ncbi:MAG: hypothetical protein ACQEQF_00380 [Bacillota bacterium]